MPSFYVENFGCRATQADGAAIERQFQEHGMEPADCPQEAQFVVLNTCCVTAAAEQDARTAVRRLRRRNPGARVIVTGCYAQRAPEEIAALAGVDLVIGNSHKHNLARITVDSKSHMDIAHAGSFVPVSALESGGSERVFVSDIFAHTELLAAPVFSSANERTRPNLKVQDGCNNRCSFCIIPSVRGRSRSLPLEEVIAEVNQLVAAGYREVVISGINLGRWGRDLDNNVTWGRTPSSVRSSAVRQAIRETNRAPRIEELIQGILDQTFLEKLRISSVEPMDWSDSLIRLMAESPRIAKHAHVPMQSGSDTVLRRMHRKYRPWHYREKVEKIRAAMPDAAIGADVMVGFPGESESEFDETRRIVEELPFSYLHVFTFSARPGTPAAIMPDQVPHRIAHERNRILRELAEKKKFSFMHSFIGRSVEAITLNVTRESNEGACTEALTDNYLKLNLRGRHAPNQWMSAQVQDVNDGELIAVN